LFFLFSKFNNRVFVVAAFLVLMIGSAYFRSYSLDFGLSHLASSIFAYFINFGTGIVFAVRIAFELRAVTGPLRSQV